MIKNIIRKIIYKEKASSEDYVDSMVKKGARIGKGTVVFAPTQTMIDMTRPWLIEIGENVQITEGVKILTHGYDWSVIKGVTGEILGSAGKVTIGNNVFIGMNSIILKGVTIGNNVIIGAGSLVNKDIPDNCVVAGNPAKVIMSLEDYCEKRKAVQVEEVTELIREYRKVYNKDPSEEELSEFFWLFTDDSGKLHSSWEEKMRLVNNYDLSCEKLNGNKKVFENMQDMLDKIN